MPEFLANNWFWVVLVLLFVGMHSFGGGCCGVGPRQRKKNVEADDPEDGRKSCH
ncbi:MAG: DUF2933 domain-containing protein [Deltaproteobacteria bacterium]|nr:DUF2933 domain-containing protein [Deltaproteobacteria bacterium]